MKLHHPEVYSSRYADTLKRIEKNFKDGKTIADTMLPEVLSGTPLTIYLYPLVQSFIAESDNAESFLLLQKHEKMIDLYSEVVNIIEAAFRNKAEGLPPISSLTEEVVTAVKFIHAFSIWEKHGKRIYEVHPDLSWALFNTDLKDFTTEELHLPHSSLYLELPPTLTIPNRYTGEHVCEGAYVHEEQLDNARIWRIMLIGRGNDTEESLRLKEEHGFDDAMFHYWIELKQPTIEECIEKQLNFAFQKTVHTYFWKGRELNVHNPAGTRFEGFEDFFIKTFRYIMNCMIYATTAESDVWFYEASKEYRNLKDRAMKAKGDKRKRLFSELKRVPSRQRVVMGSRTLIDRKKTKNDTSSTKTGSTLTKRSLVAGHWQRYWVGTGETKRCIRKLKLPFWRGPIEGECVKEDRNITHLK